MSYSDRWGWVNSSGTGAQTDGSGANIHNASDPLFVSTAIGSHMADLFKDGQAPNWIKGEMQRFVGGTLLATAHEAGGDNLFGIAQFSTEDRLIGKGTLATHGGDCTWFAAATPDNLTADGREEMANMLIEQGLELTSNSITAADDGYAVYADSPSTVEANRGVTVNDFHMSGGGRRSAGWSSERCGRTER